MLHQILYLNIICILHALKKGSNYSRIHSGIGQTLSYFSFGVDFAYLILGIPPSSDSERYFAKVGEIRNVIRFLTDNHNFDRFQIWTYNGDTLRHPAPDVSKDRSHMSQQARLSRENILSRNISWTKGKKFLRTYNIEMR